MGEHVTGAGHEKLLRLIGLGVRSRLAVVGVDQVRRAALKGKLKVAVIAPDASKNSLDKVVPLLEARRVRVIQGPAASELGRVVGRETTAVVGIVDADLARGMVEASGDQENSFSGGESV